uniref:Uncharacterized protein n=1 Tax=Escherichia coli TaxID=562 RepID=A0A1B2RB56_ECOLX|nr:hypothetical protein [Escherichia coli]
MMVLKRILSTSVLTATTRHCAKATHGKVASTTTANDRRFRISKREGLDLIYSSSFYAGAIFRWESRYQRLRYCPFRV